MSITPDQIAGLVLQQFDKLPSKRKPIVRDNGFHEWVPLSGIIAKGKDNTLKCLSFATGMKCLPHAKLPLAQGNVLHDWHAEVLAIRAFNRFVLDECKAICEGSLDDSKYLRRRGAAERQRSEGPKDPGVVWGGQPFAWREEVKLYMYCSEAPCGDASMELTMSAQEDATPWDVPESSDLSAEQEGAAQAAAAAETLPGRAYFSRLGLVRRKPARGDAPPTASKSCSDKLALKQCTSLLSSLTSLLVCSSNVYIDTLVMPRSQLSATGCSRAFSAEGRMAPASRLDFGGSGYSFRPFGVESTDREFAFSKRSVEARAGRDRMVASNLAIAWTNGGLEEASLGGTQQGRKPFDPRGASFASRRRMWALAVEVAGLVGEAILLREALAAKNYCEIKDSEMLKGRRQVKAAVKVEALKGWTRNVGDDDFTLQ